MAARACSSVWTSCRIGGEASSSPATSSSARRLNPPTALACQHAEGAQKPPDLSLQLDPDLHHGVTRCEQRADFVAGAGLDLDLPEPACAHDLCQPGRIVAVGLVGPHLESRVGVARIEADHG